MEQKTRSKFLPWPGWNLGPWHLEAVDVGTRLPRTPPFSRFLRHAGDYSRTILTPNLQGIIQTMAPKNKWIKKGINYFNSVVQAEAGELPPVISPGDFPPVYFPPVISTGDFPAVISSQ